MQLQMLDSTPSIRIRSFLQIAPYLAKRGVSSIEFFERLGMSPNVFQNADGWIPRAQCFHVANEMAYVASDAFAGGHVGSLTQLQELGDWGRSVLTAPDIAHACARAAANARMLHRGSDVRFSIDRRIARIHFRFEGRWEFDPRQFIFGSLAVLRKVPLLTGEPSAIRVHLSAAATRGSEALEACLGPNIEMGCDDDMVEFDRELLDLPLTKGERMPFNAAEGLRTTVAAALLVSRTLAESGKLTADAVARRLGLSRRTLQRRLKYCGVVFEDLLDETRRSEAIRLLAEGEHSMTEIAYRLGYSDPAHFTRAFKRWKGVTPSRFNAEVF
jgi:AraC-like DNA-binding protein